MAGRERPVTGTVCAPVAYRRVLVRTDGSRRSENAADHAIYLVRDPGARPFADYSMNVGRAFHAGIHFGEAVTYLKPAGKEDTAAITVMAVASRVACEEIQASGGSHRALNQRSDEVGADLIAAGSTNTTFLRRVLMSGQPGALMRLSECPCLLAREP